MSPDTAVCEAVVPALTAPSSLPVLGVFVLLVDGSSYACPRSSLQPLAPHLFLYPLTVSFGLYIGKPDTKLVSAKSAIRENRLE